MKLLWVSSYVPSGLSSGKAEMSDRFDPRRRQLAFHSVDLLPGILRPIRMAVFQQEDSPPEGDPAEAGRPHVAVAHEAADEDVADPLFLEDVSQARLYKSVSVFFVDNRVFRAAIEAGGRSLTEIALERGFEVPDTFARAFRRCFGMLPSEARSLSGRRGPLSPRGGHRVRLSRLASPYRDDSSAGLRYGRDGRGRPRGSRPPYRIGP